MDFFKKLMGNLSLTAKFSIVLGFVLLISIINYSTIQYFQSQQEADGAIIDAAGRQRMLSQRIGFYAEQIVNGNDEAKTVLLSLIDLHQSSLLALKNGGVAKGVANR